MSQPDDRRPTPARRRARSLGRAAAIGGAVLVAWIAASLAWPRQTDLRRFDAPAVGRIEAAMWRSYYERKPVRLFWQLSHSLRVQFHTGVVRSFPGAYYAAKAAFVFKDGRSRDEYGKALPALARYFQSINDIAA